ncbi:MAG: response regulator transcription factor [Lachnospiraceae bacterium]|nr:response regulator transcription factor [Lachnospiraceae bacterium]
MIKVMICDDIDDIRDYYREIIRTQGDMQVVAEAAAMEAAVEKALIHKPDIILMDVQMEEENSGIVATERIMQLLPETKVIVVTVHNDDDLVVDAYMAGAVDYMVKGSNAEAVCAVIRKTYAAEDFLGVRIAVALKACIKKARRQEKSMLYLINNMIRLTTTEKIILEQLYQKKKRRKIAEENFMSEETVKIHIRHILRKLEFDSTAEMIRELEKMGVMEIWEKMDRE